MALRAFEHIVYGPVRSRRLGASLGVNLLPGGMKVCNLDCAYCQYGSTRYRGRGVGWPMPQAVEAAVAARLTRAAENDEIIERMTIAGHGEPTLHPEFEEIAARLCAARDRIAPGIALAILSNSTTAAAEGVRRGLALLDERYMKLDAGDPITYACINGGGTPVARVVDGLRALPGIVIRAMFVTDRAGRIDNTGDGAVHEWLRALEEVNAVGVQIGTLDPAPALGSLRPASTGRLREIASQVRAARIPAQVFA
jgi:wyosine [tRNA(Phe)-imidazoG37] synthetase (radical SAM superfamily)